MICIMLSLKSRVGMPKLCLLKKGYWQVLQTLGKRFFSLTIENLEMSAPHIYKLNCANVLTVKLPE